MMNTKMKLMFLAMMPALVLTVVSSRALGGDDPNVDAGVDMITWSNEPVQLDPNILTAGDILWTADDADAVFDPAVNSGTPNTSADEAPTVTITRPEFVKVRIPNASFEERETFDPFTEGTDRYFMWAQEFWRQFEIDNNGGPVRVWNPGVPGVDETTQGAFDVGFSGNAPDGKYVAVVRTRYNDDQVNFPGVRDFEAAVQLLDATFNPSASYTLTAKVGNLLGSANYNPLWYGYAVQLVVGGTNVGGSTYQGHVIGGTVIAEDYNTETVPVDTFVTSTVEYTPTDPNFALAGLPLQIRLCALENPLDHSTIAMAAFDDVELYSNDPALPHVVELTVTVDDAGTPVEDTMTVDVYKTACAATLANYPEILDTSDYNTDCVTNLYDFAEIAATWDNASSLQDLLGIAEKWLNHTELAMPIPKDGPPADYHGNLIINLEDFAVLASMWGDSTGIDDLAVMAETWLVDYTAAK